MKKMALYIQIMDFIRQYKVLSQGNLNRDDFIKEMGLLKQAVCW